MESKFYSAFAPYVGKYPVLAPSNALDFRSLGTIAPDTFMSLIKTAVDFRTKYADLLQKVSPDSNATATLNACDAWATFLWGNTSAAVAGQPPPPQAVQVALYQGSQGEFQNAASVYGKLTIQLPLLQNGQPAPPIVVSTSTAAGEIPRDATSALSKAQTYQWSLTGGAGYPACTGFVSELNERGAGRYPARLDAFSIPGNPWLLLMIMGSNQSGNLGGGQFSIPIVMQAPGGEKMGFFVAFRLGDGRSYPGTIPPPRAVGPKPVMSEAQPFLQGAGG
jgi:hypothetical protein